MENRGGSELGVTLQTILIVEDEALVRLDAADFLRQGGYRVHEAGNANDAMESLQSEFAVDLLFTDINLGKGMNGIELAMWDSRKFAGRKDPCDDRRDIENRASPSSGGDIAEALCMQ